MKAAIALRFMNLICMVDIVSFATKDNPDVPVKPVLQRLASTMYVNHGLTVDLDARTVDRIKDDLLFPVSSYAGRVYFKTSASLGKTAFDEAERIMAGFKERASDIKAGRLVQRMRQEIEKLLALLA